MRSLLNPVRTAIIFVAVLFSVSASAQKNTRAFRDTSRVVPTPGIEDHASARDTKGYLYITWGYNKNWYTKTNVRVWDPGGSADFTLYKMKAHDHTHFNELLKVQPSIPQYGYCVGYWMPEQGRLSRFGFELKFDHAKYIVYDYQHVHMEGHIGDKIYNTDTIVDPDHFLHLEHTDGANFLMFNLMTRRKFISTKNFGLYGVAKAGAGIVIPRSDVTLFGERWNHCFHVAGQVMGVETGFRAEFFRIFFFDLTTKGVFCNFNRVLANNPYLISHRFFDGMVLADVGACIPLGNPGKLPKRRSASTSN